MLRNDKSKEKRYFMEDDPWEPAGKKHALSESLNNSSTKVIMAGLNVGLPPIIEEDETGLDEGLPSILEEDESTSNSEMTANLLTQRQAEEAITRYRDIDCSIQINDEEMIAASLDYLKTKNLIVPYLSVVNYKIAFWAFEQESKIVLAELFKEPEERHQFLVASHNNYQITKEFIHRSINLSFEQFQQQAESKQYILNLLLRTKTHNIKPIIRSVIDEYRNNADVDKETINALKAMVNKIIKDLPEELTDEVSVKNSESQVLKFK